MAAYTGLSTIDDHINDENNHSSAMTGTDSMSLSTTTHDEQQHDRPSVEAHPDTPLSETIKGSRRSTVYFLAILLTSIIPFVGMIAWLVTVEVRQGSAIFASFTSAKIGGHLTQTQAKAIDFSCSALVAPLLMAGLNFIWFACARVCVVNEHSATHLGNHGVPLQSLARASRTTVGTYDFIGLWELLSAKTWRLSVLGAVVLLSAISSSALSNIIAYESFEEEDPSLGSYTLRMLSDDDIDLPAGLSDVWQGIGAYGNNRTRLNFAAHNISMMLDGLLYENATLDSEGGYIGSNATDQTLDSIEGNIASLHNVPGYRLTASCTPTTSTKNSILMTYTELGVVYLTMSVNWTPAVAAALNVTEVTAPSLVEYFWTGLPDDLFSRGDFAGHETDFPAFDLDTSAVNLVHLTFLVGLSDGSDDKMFEQTIPTAWGDMYPVHQNMTFPEVGPFDGHSYEAYAYALQCVLLRQDGLLEYRRRGDQTWLIADSNFQDEQVAVRSFLKDLQSPWPPDLVIPPLWNVLWGGAAIVEFCNEQMCYGHRDFTTAVNNLVYASGEAIRIIHNVAALDESCDNMEYCYNVTGEVNRQFYRITYVPVLLLVALLGIVISALLVTVLVFATMKTWSWKTFRQVDITRLVVDCVSADLAKDDSTFSRLRRASDDELADWASRYCVGYEKVVDIEDMDGDERPSIRLRHFTVGDVQKANSCETVRSVESSG